MLHVVCNSEERAKVVMSQIELVIRPMYSSPPIHGSLGVFIIAEPPPIGKVLSLASSRCVIP